jgi:hypothetical protein
MFTSGAVFLLVALLCTIPASASDQAENTPVSGPKTNLLIMQEITGDIVREVLIKTGITKNDTVVVDLIQSPDAWITQTGVLSALKSVGCAVYLKGAATASGNFQIGITQARMQVNYDDLTRSGFLGQQHVRRTVSGAVSFQVIKTSTGEVLFGGLLNRSVPDTVAVDRIPDLESSAAASTHAPLPDENFLDRFVEPFVIIGATGLAVYLFFHVRS